MDTFKAAQKVLKDLKFAKKDQISQLSPDILNRIFLMSDLQVIKRCKTLSTNFCEKINSVPLFRAIAKLQNITLENGVDPKIQVEQFSPIENAMISLKFLDSHFENNFALDSECEIEEKGGICLVPNQHLRKYGGIAVIKETTPEGKKWFLHFCHGDSFSFSAKELNNIIPLAIAKLKELKITPDYLAQDYLALGDTMKNFENWQKEQKKNKTPSATV
jgi:hypothetical protein